METNGQPIYGDMGCPNCQWLGSFGIDGHNADLYFCPQTGAPLTALFGGPTVIAQHSEEGGDDSSGIFFAAMDDPNPYLHEAANRAAMQGLLPPDWREVVLEAQGGGRIIRFGGGS